MDFWLNVSAVCKSLSWNLVSDCCKFEEIVLASNGHRIENGESQVRHNVDQS